MDTCRTHSTAHCVMNTESILLRFFNFFLLVSDINSKRYDIFALIIISLYQEIKQENMLSFLMFYSFSFVSHNNKGWFFSCLQLFLVFHFIRYILIVDEIMNFFLLTVTTFAKRKSDFHFISLINLGFFLIWIIL